MIERILWFFIALVVIVALYGIITKKKPEAPADPALEKKVPETKPAKAEHDAQYFKISIDDPEPLFKAFGELNDAYKLSKRDLIDEGYIEDRVYKYDVIEGPAEIKDDQVYFHDILVGPIKRNDKKKVQDLLLAGASPVIRIYGGQYKYIAEDFDFDKDREVYELETGESTITGSLVLKKSPL